MKLTAELWVYNNVTHDGLKATLEGKAGQDIVDLVLKGNNVNITVELSASQLVIAASRIGAAPDGLMSFPK